MPSGERGGGAGFLVARGLSSAQASLWHGANIRKPRARESFIDFAKVLRDIVSFLSAKLGTRRIRLLRWPSAFHLPMRRPRRKTVMCVESIFPWQMGGQHDI